MNAKIAILIILAVSLAVFGCAKKAETQNATQGTGQAGAGGGSMGAGGSTPAESGANATVPPAGGANASANASAGAATGGADGDKNKNLSDLFNIDTDKPFGDEGLDTGTPSSVN